MIDIAKNKWCPMVLASAPVPTAADYTTGQKASGITVGDTVKVLRKAQDHENGWGDCWERKMDTLVGQTFVVNKQNEKSGFHVPGGWLPFFVLEKVASPPWTPKPGDWVIVVRPNLRAEVLATWGEIAWLNLNGNAVTYGFDELRPIPPEPKKREWRQWDIVVITNGSFCIRIFEDNQGSWRSNEQLAWLNDDEIKGMEVISVFNLLDLLAGGEILVALIEDEAKRGELALFQDNDSRNNHLWQKVSDALIAYQKRK